jgi:hypothetical protein
MYSNEQIFTAVLELSKTVGVPFYFSNLITNEQEFKEHVRFHDGKDDWLIPDWTQPQPYNWEDILAIIDSITENISKQKCKEQARKLLSESDWAATTDVQSCIENPLDWLNYRDTVRKLFLRPEVNPTFPVKPEVRWII